MSSFLSDWGKEITATQSGKQFEDELREEPTRKLNDEEFPFHQEEEALLPEQLPDLQFHPLITYQRTQS